MINGKSIAVVMPAFRAGQTLEATWDAMPHEVIDHILLVDDASDDDTVAIAEKLGIEVKIHPSNRGYGANQKTCYSTVLEKEPDIVVMLHPDYQYDPRLLVSMSGMIASGVYDIVIGSRILGGGALRGGMPLWKYVANRSLTAFQNLLLGSKLSEYHTGYRAYSAKLLNAVCWQDNSDDFIFDNQLLAQTIAAGFPVGEISVPTKYFEEASSINFSRSVRYGLGVVGISILGLLNRLGLYQHSMFSNNPKLYLDDSAN
jgi:glycosyltransferase involved in cell wall biosynthesis